MSDLLIRIRQELLNFKNVLENDINEFNSKLNLTRKNVLDFFDQQIEYLTKIKNDYEKQFNYLDEENTKTCLDNQQEFDKLCLTINQNAHQPLIVSTLLQNFKQKFPLRPKMFKSIPEYNLKDIQIDHLIVKQNCSMSPITDNKWSSPLRNKSLISELSDHSFVPIDNIPISSLSTTSIGSSYHKQLALQNNLNEVESQSRLVSTCSTMSGTDNIIDILFQIPYDHNRTPHLMSFNEEDNYVLIYPLSSRHFEYFSLNSRKIFSINFSSDESILTLGYSSKYHLFYYSSRKRNHLTLFRFNQEKKEIEIEQKIELIDYKDHFVNVHIYQNFIYYLYLTSEYILMLGKYDLLNSSFLPLISFEKKLYDYEEKSPYRIIDFTINESFIYFLIQFKDKNKSKIIIHHYQTMEKLHSFDLIDAIKPISIIPTEKKCPTSATTICNDDIELLLYINDPVSRLIHCCTYQEYLIPVHVTNFGVCSLDDGNLLLVTKRDIRLLNVQNYLQTNKQS